MVKRMTNKEKAERAAIKKKLQADGILPPDKPRLNRRKFIDDALGEFNAFRKKSLVSDLYLHKAVGIMLGMKKRSSPTPEAIGVAKALRLAVRLREFDEMVRERGDERMVLMIKVALIVLGFAAGAACAAVKAAAFQQEKYRN